MYFLLLYKKYILILIITRKGDIIKVLEKDASGWWVGELNGTMGFFPSVEWVEEIRDNPAPAASQPQYGAPPPVNRAMKQPQPAAQPQYQQPTHNQPQYQQPTPNPSPAQPAPGQV